MQKIYLEEFSLPSSDMESSFLFNFKMTCYNNFYPFNTLPVNFRKLKFFPITVLYGSNGCGKTTILNLIADKLNIRRSVKINKSSFTDPYVKMCSYKMKQEPTAAKIITSDDVFSNIFLTRDKNDIIDKNREEALKLSELCNTPGVYLKDIMHELIGDEKWIDNVDTVLKVTSARGKTKSRFARETVPKNIIGKSNGETALEYFYSNINEPGLYLLDEPENSLSASYQRELSQYLFEAVRFFDTQLIIATHSPFMLSIPDANIYNLDSEEFKVTHDWTTLDNMIEYYRLFSEFSEKFETN